MNARTKKRVVASAATKKTGKKTVNKAAKVAVKKAAKTAIKKPVTKKPVKKALKKQVVVTKKSASKKQSAKKTPTKKNSVTKVTRTKKSAASTAADVTLEAKTESAKRKRRKKTDPESANDEIVDVGRGSKSPTGNAKSTNGSLKTKPGRKKKGEGNKSLTEEFLEEGMETAEEEEVTPDLVDLDPLDAPVVLDPESDNDTAAKSKTAAAKPKSGKLAPRTHTCVSCEKQVTWTSTDRLCFNCVKKDIAQRRNDDSFGMSKESGKRA